jgi:IMP dehydrogenase
MHFEETFTFNDVLIKPQYSEIRSRSEIDLSVKLSKGLNFKVPVMPANMQTIVNIEVAQQFYQLGGLCLLHRFCPIEEQINICNKLHKRYADAFNYIGVSVGVKNVDYENINVFYKHGVRIVCIDVAHGDSINCVEMTKFISEKYPDIFLIAGNVSTGSGAFRLWLAGADAVKINQGSGSTCTTRIATGCGVPQLSALADVFEVRKNNPMLQNKFIIADGGCSKVGDLVKSLALSDLVMTGNMFAGAAETPGQIVEIDGKEYKNYDGSSTHRGGDYIEGVQSLVECKPDIKTIMKTMLEGISSGCSYTGSKNLQELKEKTIFIKISNAGMTESNAHDVKVIK